MRQINILLGEVRHEKGYAYENDLGPLKPDANFKLNEINFSDLN